jgi:hypothetical protein
MEAETSIYFEMSGSGAAVISSHDPSVIKRLLNLECFSEDRRESYDRRGTEVITYIDGTVPIGAITIGKPRKRNGTSLVVKGKPYIYTDAQIEMNKKIIKERLAGKHAVKK